MAIDIDTYAKIDLDKLDKVFDSLLEQVMKSEGEEKEK